MSALSNYDIVNINSNCSLKKFFFIKDDIYSDNFNLNSRFGKIH